MTNLNIHTLTTQQRVTSSRFIITFLALLITAVLMIVTTLLSRHDVLRIDA